MSSIVDNVIQRWRKQRNIKMLHPNYNECYAFVGVGSHALQNLYPVLQYLGIKLKYVCCKNSNKIPLIEQRFDVIGTTSLDMILNDDEVKGVFVCTSPQSHYELCHRVIKAGKYLFVEKPPCQNIIQLKELINLDCNHTTMVGVQKRYSPFVQTLKNCLHKSRPISYTMIYHTGSYPEGNPLTELFIHPMDLVTHLFGKAEVKGFQRLNEKETTTIQILLSHKDISGFIELSTAHSWAVPKEQLHINTYCGEYRLENMEKLTYYPHTKKICGVPLEKLGLFTAKEQILAMRNNFSPLVSNNQLYSQGFLSEIKSFVDMVEHSGKNISPLPSLLNTYQIIDSIGEDGFNQNHN